MWERSLPENVNEKHRQLAKLFGRLSMLDKNEMELIADCHGVTEVNLTTALGFYSMTSSIKSLERMERAQELVTSLCGSVPRSIADRTEDWKLARSSRIRNESET